MDTPCLPVSSSLIAFLSFLVSRGDLAGLAFGKDLPKWDDDPGPPEQPSSQGMQVVDGIGAARRTGFGTTWGVSSSDNNENLKCYSVLGSGSLLGAGNSDFGDSSSESREEAELSKQEGGHLKHGLYFILLRFYLLIRGRENV